MNYCDVNRATKCCDALVNAKGRIRKDYVSNKFSYKIFMDARNIKELKLTMGMGIKYIFPISIFSNLQFINKIFDDKVVN